MLTYVALCCAALLCSHLTVAELDQCIGRYRPEPIHGYIPPAPFMNQNCQEVASACECVTNTLADRLEIENDNDKNKDGMVYGHEFLFLTMDADYDYDGCASPNEAVLHDVPVYGYSNEWLYDFAVFFATTFPDPTGNNCTGYSYQGTLNRDPIPLEAAKLMLLQWTIGWCEGDQSRYESNCDCAQLPATCKNTRFSESDACKEYVQNLAEREGCIYTAPASEEFVG